MPTENKVAPNIQAALDYSRNFATAKPNIGLTEKEHIEGLANLLERTALESSGLQALLTAADERADVLEGLLREWLIDFGRTHSGLQRLKDRTMAELRKIDAALKPAEPEPHQGIPGTSFQRLNALANQGE